MRGNEKKKFIIGLPISKSMTAMNEEKINEGTL